MYLSIRQMADVLVTTLLAPLGSVALANGPGTPPAFDLTGPGFPGGTISPDDLLNPDATLDPPTGFQGTPDLRSREGTLDSEHGPVLNPASRPDAPVTA
jgi:hypothetical protein